MQNNELSLPKFILETPNFFTLICNYFTEIETFDITKVNNIFFDNNKHISFTLLLVLDQHIDYIKNEDCYAYLAKFDRIRANVDIKTVDALEKVYPLAKEYNVEDRIFYTGVKDEFVDSVKTDSPEIAYYLNVNVDKSKNTDREYLLALVEKVKNAGAIGINFNYKSASKELVEIFHENGLLVSIWTVDDKYNMCKILSFVPDNITTRHPDKLSEIIK